MGSGGAGGGGMRKVKLLCNVYCYSSLSLSRNKHGTKKYI